MKKKYIIVVSLALLAVANTVLLVAQKGPGGNNDPDRSPMVQFMGADCRDAQLDVAIAADLRKNSVEAEAYFMEIATQGPRPKMLEAERAAARALYQQRLEFDKGHKVTRVGYDDPAAGQVTQEAFVERRMADFKQRITYRALQGLWVIETPTSMAYLGRLAKDAKSPWQEDAKALLASSR